MRSKALFPLLLFVSSVLAQTDLTTQQFNQHLEEYIQERLTRVSKESLDKERFLIQQIRMLNDEIKSRVANVSEKRDNYFSKLERNLNEIRDLKRRLPGGSGGSLIGFINDLEKRIELTLENGIIDYKRQQVFDDAVQLLYLAEELMKLDPASNLSENPRIAEGIQETRAKFRTSFGDIVPSAGSGAPAGQATIFNLYDEWQRTERLSYLVRLTDVQIVKKRLLKNGTIAEIERMFKRELFRASEAFNLGRYEVARMSFDEMIEAYPSVGALDDVTFYKGESNFYLGRYNQARQDYQSVITNYPASAYVGESYRRLIYIADHFEQYDQAISYFRQMQSILSSQDYNYQRALLLAVNAAFKGGLFQDAVTLAYEIDPQSPYYDTVRFIQAQALAGTQNLEDARDAFNAILGERNLEPEFRFDVLTKLGFVLYEMGLPDQAVEKFKLINPDYSRYDLVMLGFGWSYYKIELDKRLSQNRDFSDAKRYLEIIVNDYTNSEYALEARTLLGYINQLEFDTNGAIDNFRYAYNAKDVKLLSDELNTQQDELEKIVDTAHDLEQEALVERNVEAFNRAVRMRESVEGPLFKLKYADLSPVGAAAASEVTRLRGQLEELDRLKALAVERNESEAVDRIEEMQLKIYRAINSFSGQQDSPLGFNYFDEHPLARKESVVEHDNARLIEMREESRTQREQILQKIARLDVEILNAKSRRDYKKMSNLEVAKNRFEDLLNKLDYVESWVYSMKTRSTNINLARWSDYGAFGLANVNFAVRALKDQQISDMRSQIQEINDLLNNRKQEIVHKINQIEDEITLMTRRVRRQERIREREELYRQFEESYFDTHESETEQPLNTVPPNNTLPPNFEEEED